MKNKRRGYSFGIPMQCILDSRNISLQSGTHTNTSILFLSSCSLKFLTKFLGCEYPCSEGVISTERV